VAHCFVCDMFSSFVNMKQHIFNGLYFEVMRHSHMICMMSLILTCLCMKCNGTVYRNTKQRIPHYGLHVEVVSAQKCVFSRISS
jgi:hypothetical protein